MAKTQYTDDELKDKALQLVMGEKAAWENATAFITPTVAFDMRNLIKKCRKNYWGVFEDDPKGAKEKVWVHLTQEFVDAMRKGIDMDAKDMDARGKGQVNSRRARGIRSIFKNYLDNTYFGQDLDKILTVIGIDGTCVLETQKGYNADMRRQTAQRRIIDLLNVYIDPTAKSIQDAYRFTVRDLLTADEVKAMKGWIDTNGIEGTEGLHPTDTNLSATDSTSKFVDVWTMHGKGPKSLITGKHEHDTIEVDLKIVVSGLDGESKRVHLIETYTDFKPYEEFKLFDVPNRWYGMGIAEKLIMYQLWANTVVNIRIARARVSQLGIFLVRSGSGITQQMLSRLASTGVVPVGDIERDIKQLPMDEAAESSYKDEEIIQQRAQRVTGTYEAATGEALPSSTPATNAVIQNNAAQTGITLLKEGVGHALERWAKRHALPIELSCIPTKEVIRMHLDPDEMRELDEERVDSVLASQLQQMNQAGVMYDPVEALMERDSAIQRLKKYPDRFMTYDEALDAAQFDIEFVITNEKLDKGVLSQNLLTAVQLAPEYKDQILQAAFDIWGLDLKQPTANPMAMMQMMQQPTAAVPGQDMQQAFTQPNLQPNATGQGNPRGF